MKTEKPWQHAIPGPLNKGQITTLISWLRTEFRKRKAKVAVVGLSGGVDSAVVAALAVLALGSKRVIGVWMPYENGVPFPVQDAKDVGKFSRKLGIRTWEAKIGEVVFALRRLEPTGARGRVINGNLMARVRMIILYEFAAANRGLVLGTGNYSEISTGYFTKHGDGACDLLPIGDVYKSQVWPLARRLGIPRSIIEKPPSAGLWPGQTDEGELGITYGELDAILYYMDLNATAEKTADCTGIPLKKVKMVYARALANLHKVLPVPRPLFNRKVIPLNPAAKAG